MQAANDFFLNLNQWFWFCLGAVLMVLEVILGAGFFLLWSAFAAIVLGMMLVARVLFTWHIQFLLFGTIALGCIFLWVLARKYSRRRLFTSRNPNQGYIASTFTLDDPIINGKGQLKINDTLWAVEGPDLPKGASVKVIGVEGMILKVINAEGATQA